MRQNITIILLGLMMLMLSSVIQASVSIPLNTVAVPVVDYTPASRQAAMLTAFDQVLVKMTGNPQAATQPNLKKARSQASQWVQSYRYITPSPTQNGLKLAVTFDQSAITQLLNQANQPLWPANRPQTLVWITTNSTIPLIADTADNQVLSLFQYAADSRGLPLLLPKANAQDETQDSTTELETQDPANPLPPAAQEALFTEPALQTLQQQYQSDAVLAGNIQQVGDAWQATWWLWYNHQLTKWQNNNPDLNALVTNATNRVVTLLLARPDSSATTATANTTTTAVQLAIMGINDLAGFDQILKYVKGLPIVQDAEVSDTSNDGLLLKVTLNGQEQDLVNVLNNNSQMVALPPQSHSQTLYYRWLGPEASNPVTNNQPDNSGYTALPPVGSPETNNNATPPTP